MPDAARVITVRDRLARRATMVAFAIQGLTFASIVTRLPTFKDRLDLADVDILVLLAAVAVMSAAGSLVAGYTSERWGSAGTLRLSLVGVSLGAVLPSFAGSLPTLVATTCVYGAFIGAVDATMNMQGVGVQDRYGRSIMTGFHATWSGAAVIGAGYASLTIVLDWPLLVSLGLVALVGLALNATSGRWLLSDTGLDAPLADDAPLPHVPWGPVLLLAVPTFAMWLTDSATSVWSGIYLEDGLSAAASAAPIAYGAYQAVLLLVRLVGDRIIGRYGAAATARGSGVVAVAGLALIVAAPSLPMVFLGFGLLGGGLSLIPPLSFVAAGHLDTEGGSLAVARVNVANYLGYLVAAFAIAFVAQWWGHRAMFVVPLVVALLIPVMARQFTPRVRSAAPI